MIIKFIGSSTCQSYKLTTIDGYTVTLTPGLMADVDLHLGRRLLSNMSDAFFVQGSKAINPTYSNKAITGVPENK